MSTAGRPGTGASPGGCGRREVLARAAEVVSGGAAPDPGAAALVRRYYRHVADDDVLRRDPTDLAGAVLAHRRLAGRRAPGGTLVEVFTPDVDSHGWQTGHTVVQVVTDDMPFLVDSVTNALTAADRGLHLVVHPVVVVRRDAEGGLLEVLDASTSALASGHRAPHWPADAVAESWMHVEVDRDTGPGAAQEISAAVTQVLQDVRTAVEDWPAMLARTRDLAAAVQQDSPEDLADEAATARRLLEWLADGSFTFLGYREYTLEEVDGAESLRVVPGTGLGILRQAAPVDGGASEAFERMSPAARERSRDRTVLVLTKGTSRSTVHRPAYLDYVGVKTFDADGAVNGERRLLGLLTSSAYTESVRTVPVIDRKVADVLDRAGLAPDSHSGKVLLTILETFPRDELFQTPTDDLYDTALAVMHLQERRRTRLFLRTDDYRRFVSALVFLPRDRYTTAVRLRISELLTEAFGAASLDYTTRVSDSVLARLHFVVRLPAGAEVPQVDLAALEAAVVDATRTWEEDLLDALVREEGQGRASALVRRWGSGFPEAYKEDFPARAAVADLRRLEEACAGTGHASASGGTPTGVNLYEPVGAGPFERRLKLYRTSTLSLTTVLPYFRDLGLEVVDERPYRLERADGGVAYVYDFGLRLPGTSPAWATREMVTEAFTAAWTGAAESDGLNQLVLRAGMPWREVVVLRAYVRYLRQVGSTFGQEYVERVLLAHADLARSIVRVFAARFDPDHGRGGLDPAARRETTDALVEELTAGLDDVDSLDADRILRSLLAMVLATDRTSFYQHADDGTGHKPSVAFKIDPHRVPDLPEPVPAHEIWVYSPRVEGVHLRFGSVARGGLRWSDRREDFRTEVLGLVKAQMVKNAVIVPTGAKGGFVPKQLPGADDREAFTAEGRAAYRIFVSSLLDVTDDLVPDPTADGSTGRRVEPPPRVVRHDGDDSYLVVAADKGTATFSDLANEVAAGYGFWLGDAFASGGSVGYDHKAMGITARGAWESVARHFRETGHDVMNEPFTVVGVGDMSGDVFGNGMLLSPHIRLVAAFDHRHLFLDPDPDPATSVAERRRLFALPRSSWADYDTSLLSPGGGVWSRSAKSVPVSPQVRERLGLPPGTTRLTPAELMRAVLLAPVDLLWNGGIGTYVKASAETDAQVGDRANDAIRVDGRDLRVAVVGEGGNLGLTQLGRIEAARNGVRVNTDAIDNSAGVDCSDHEVNIKILLDQVVADGDLTGKQRTELLAQMTDDVADLVLRDNYEQNVLLGNARAQGSLMLSVHARLMTSLEASGRLDRALEFLPSAAQVDRLAAEGLGLTSPEASVLVAYAKITLGEALLAGRVCDDPWFDRVLTRYFPRELVERYPERLATHPLARQIVATSLANDVVNRGGITFVFRAQEETGASVDAIVRAYTVAREVFGLPGYVAAVEALDLRVPTELQSRLYLGLRRLIDRSVRWILQNRPGELDVAAEIDRFGPATGRWRGRMAELLQGEEAAALARDRDRLVEAGVGTDLAERCAGLLVEFGLLDVTEVAAASGVALDRVAEVYFHVSERFGIDVMLTAVSRLDRTSRWEALARGALRDDLYAALMGLTRSVLDLAAKDRAAVDADPAALVDAWERANGSQLARARATIDEVRALEHGDLAAMSVALRVLRGVIRAGAAT